MPSVIEERGRPPTQRSLASQRRRRQRRRALVGSSLVIGLAVFAAVLLSTTTGSHRTTAPPSQPTVPRHPTTTATSPATTTIPPGQLPQTTAEPGFGPRLTTPMQTLFESIVQGSSALGRTVFFPKGAYVSMKHGILPDPASDYQNRLIAFFDLDLGAYHSALGSPPSAAHLVKVKADRSLAQWIAPGTCENNVGYWHLPGTRLVYSQNGIIKSFRVASLISWRGQWYVVHLGPNPRPADVGTVDDPQVGAGVPGPGGGC